MRIWPSLLTVLFWSLKVCKSSRKAWSISSHEWCQCLPRWTEGKASLTEDWAWGFSCSYRPSAECLQSRKLTIHSGHVRNTFFWPTTLRPPSTLIGIHVIHVMRYSLAFPSVFAYCKYSKTGQQEDLGTRLYTTHCYYRNKSEVENIAMIQWPNAMLVLKVLC